PELPRKRAGRVEVYRNVRYFTATGEHYPDSPKQVNEFPEKFATLMLTLDPQLAAQQAAAGSVNKSALTSLQKWDLCTQGLWEDAGFPSQSDADLFYCGRLAEICNGDPVRVDARFRKTALMRDKWDEKHGADTYGNLTI